MGSLYARGKRLYLRVKIAGKWKGLRTDYRVGQETAARNMLERLEQRLSAGGEVPGDLRPLTVERYSKLWLKERKEQIKTWKNDEFVMRLHVLPHPIRSADGARDVHGAKFGDLRLDEVRPRHVIELIQAWRARTGDESMAPKSIYNGYSTLCSFFRDACLADFLPKHGSPCILTKRHLGAKVDKDPEWRLSAVYTLAELELLISDERVPMDRRVLYALEGVAALRHGEAAGLHWRNCGVKPETPPLSMLYVAYSYERALPKGDVCRPVPIHPTLAAILAEWRLFGWRQMMGRAPTADDLVLPLPPDASCKYGRWRRKGYSYDRLEEDLAALELRHRRGHDLRRTCISLARSDGAEKDILRRATHKPPKEVMDGYTTFEWTVVCRELAKLKVHRQRTGQILVIPRALAAGDSGLATVLATVEGQPTEAAEETPLALPGLEPGKSTFVKTFLDLSKNKSCVNTRTCDGGPGGAVGVEAGLTQSVCSNVANGPIAVSRELAEQLRSALESGNVIQALKLLAELLGGAR
jgi:integrase